MEKLGGKINAKDVRVSLGLIIFDDDTGRDAGSPMLRDPNNPGDWYTAVNPDGTPRHPPPRRRRSVKTNKISAPARQES